MKITEHWQKYWFSPAALINLAICRIFIVGFQIFFLIRWNPIKDLLELSKLPDYLYNPLWILHLLMLPFGWEWRPPYELLTIIVWLSLAAGILSVIGLWTRISLIFFALGNVILYSYHYSFGEIHHPEALMMISLIILAISPANAVLSVDDLRKRLIF